MVQFSSSESTTKVQSVFHLVYLSEATDELCYSDLENILFNAQTKNPRLKITGLLIYKDGLFFQLLEGDEAAVKMLLGQIIQDRRHQKVKVVSEWSSSKRILPDWSMSFIDGDLLKKDHPFLQDVLSTFVLTESPHENALTEFFANFKNDSNVKKPKEI